MQGLVSFLQNNSIFIVLIIVLAIWLGIFLFVWNTEKKLKVIEKKLESNKDEE